MNSKTLVLLAFLSSVSVFGASEADNIVGFLQKISGTSSPSDSDDNTVKRGQKGKRKSSDDNNPVIQNIVTAKNFIDNKADGIASVFPEDTPSIYVCFDYSGFKSGEIIQSIWYRVEGKGNLKEMADDAVTIPFSSTSNVCELHHSIPAGTKWQAGTYKVDIIARSRIVGSASFSVSDGSKPSKAQQVFDLVAPLLNDGNSQTQSKAPSKYSVVQKTADTEVPKLNYQGSPGGGVFNGDGFSVNYQNGWKYAQSAPDTVSFINFDGDANVVLQKVPSFGSGGTYKDVPTAISDTKEKLRAFQDCSINDENEFALNNVKYKPFSASYIQSGKSLQEWYVISASSDNKFFYLFRYTSSPEKYNKYMGTARVMFSSLTITGQAVEKKATPDTAVTVQPSPTPAPVPQQPVVPKQPEQKKASTEDFSF